MDEWKTAGEVVPFAPPVGSVWDRTPTRDQVVVVGVQDGQVIYTAPGYTGQFAMPVQQWLDFYQQGLWKRVATTIAQGGDETLVERELLRAGIKVAAAMRITTELLRTPVSPGRLEKMSFDWTNIEEDEPNVGEPEFGDDPLYREDFPYDFKWCFNNKTGEPLIWRVNPGGDGKPVHRQMYEAQGWLKGDLAMGQAWYRPPQRKLDGTITEPGLMRILYYPHTTTRVPEAIIARLLKWFPNAAVQSEEFTRGGMWTRGSYSLSQATDRLIELAQPQPQPEGWRPTPSQFAIPQQAIQDSLRRHLCPQCRGYLRDRGGVFTCTKCPFEYDMNGQAQVGMT